MFDDHNMDFEQMMKSVLDSGQEEIPTRIWDNVSSSMDKLDRRKKVIVFFRRAAAGVAVAACLVMGILLGYRHDVSENTDPLNVQSELIAVVPTKDTISDIQNIEIVAEANVKKVTPENTAITTASEMISAADNIRTDFIKEDNVEEDENCIIGKQPQVSENIQDSSETTSRANSETSTETISTSSSDKAVNETTPKKYGCPDDNMFPEIWEENDKDKGIRTSLDLSGLAATNNAQNSKRKHIMKSPTLPNRQETTGITDNSTNSTFGIPVSFGAAVRVEFTPRWSISAGLRYTLLTRKFYGTYTKVDEEGNIELTESSNIRNSQHYIGIPINAYFNIINRDFLKFYAYAGGAVEKCVTDKYQMLSSGRTHIEKTGGFQWSVDAGIGVEFSAGKHLGIYIDPSLRYYFRNDTQPKSLRTVKPLMLGFEAGIRVKL